MSSYEKLPITRRIPIYQGDDIPCSHIGLGQLTKVQYLFYYKMDLSVFLLSSANFRKLMSVFSMVI